MSNREPEFDAATHILANPERYEENYQQMRRLAMGLAVRDILGTSGDTRSRGQDTSPQDVPLLGLEDLVEPEEISGSNNDGRYN